ncbi:MAG TPA: hypothetical protein VIK78_06910 [Ruminiclostridium sp.]
MSKYKNIIKELARQYKELKNNPQKAERVGMPGSAFFLENGNILTSPRDDGDSRYQYGNNGFNFWAYSSGYMHSNDGLFTQFLKTAEGQEPKIAFYAGIPKDDGDFEPISLLSVPVMAGALNRTAEKYTVFTGSCVYYITEVGDLRFAVRVYPDEHNYLHFTITVQNLGVKSRQLFISTYFNPFLVHNFSENVENRWFREARYIEEAKYGNLGAFVIKTNEDLSRTTSVSNYGVVLRNMELDKNTTLLRQEATTSRYQYVGGSTGSLHYPASLYKGSFGSAKKVCAFTEVGIIGDMLHLEIAGSEMVRYDAELSYAVNCTDNAELDRLLSRKIASFETDRKAVELEETKKKSGEQLYCKVKGSYSDKVKDEVFNPFIEHLKNQVEFCSLLKGYVHAWAGSLIGIRDIFQSLEGLIFWKPKAARTKIIEALNFIFIDGRCPRQYSLPRSEGSAPAMDLRPFIDQGVWVISTIYSYLKVTGDFEFLKEACGYYEIVDEKIGLVRKSKEKDSILDHMLRIMEYLLSNRDNENTGCIRALYGDWNDALDGLGVSSKPGVEYGTGVSVMATLQVYQNLGEMLEILDRSEYRLYSTYSFKYREALSQLKENLIKFAVIYGENNERRILHGWGDGRSYLVGSFDDPDHCSRHGLTSNAFWVLSGMYDTDVSIKETILNAFQALDSKYGYKTFQPHFLCDTKGVGRIPKLHAGTAENGASYIHATAFAAMSLYRIGYPKKAWEQIVKILPFTHERLSHSPFIMPNSYVYNEDLQIDGESMNDWATGSSNVLLKTLVRYVFGLEPVFRGVWIQTAAWIPFEEFEFSAYVKGCRISIAYKNFGRPVRRFRINGTTCKGTKNDIMGIERLWISEEELKCGEIIIEIED